MPVIVDRVRVIVVTGGECTGKTALARTLAADLGTAWSGEYAREYAEAVGRELGPADVEPIARGQIAGEDASLAAARRAGRGVVVRDTDLVSTVVYAHHYYGACPAWVEDAARARLGDLYLLCEPDIAWEADGVRDRPAARAELHALFAAALARWGARVVPVRGTGPGRFRTARRACTAAGSATGPP